MLRQTLFRETITVESGSDPLSDLGEPSGKEGGNLDTLPWHRLVTQTLAEAVLGGLSYHEPLVLASSILQFSLQLIGARTRPCALATWQQSCDTPGQAGAEPGTQPHPPADHLKTWHWMLASPGPSLIHQGVSTALEPYPWAPTPSPSKLTPTSGYLGSHSQLP